MIFRREENKHFKMIHTFDPFNFEFLVVIYKNIIQYSMYIIFYKFLYIFGKFKAFLLIREHVQEVLRSLFYYMNGKVKLFFCL